MDTIIRLDGSEGEGGGQLLRTALGLSVATGQPFEMTRIRAGRSRPGLLRQHLAGVRLLAAMGKAEVQGAEIGSTQLRFCPTDTPRGDCEVAVGTAGSALLVLQAALPALLRAQHAVRLVIEGGTHNSGAPPFEHTQQVLLPALARMGARLSVSLERHGFYPAGGGRIVVESEPAPLGALHWLERGAVEGLHPQALLAAIPMNVGLRELRRLAKRLSAWAPAEAQDASRPWGRVHAVERPVGPGNALLLGVTCAHGAELFVGFGERSKTSETVADELADQAVAWLDAGVPVGPHTADQLLLPMALGAGGAFRTLALTPHATTNMAVIQRFLPVQFHTEAGPGDTCQVTVSPG